MIHQIFVGLMSEGNTDNRFLESVVRRTFEAIGFECKGDVEISVESLKIEKIGLDFVEQVIKASEEGFKKFGITVLCVHTDADNNSDLLAFENKINPAVNKLKITNTDMCKIITPVVPVRMIEAWMLADKDLLKNEIGTNKPDSELKIDRDPEAISDPKKTIENAIRFARQELTKRKRKDLTISELYQPIGQKIGIDKLDSLKSFKKFKEAIRKSYQELNCI